MITKNTENFLSIFFLLIPITIVLGPSVSLINIIIIDLLFIFFFYNKKEVNFFNHYTIKLFVLLNLYLIFNTLIAFDKEITLARNLGFFRFIILFVFINYFYNYAVNKKKILNFWTFFILIIIFDIYFEFFFGSNIFGWGPRFIDGVEQLNGRRIMSFFKDEPIAGAFLSGFIFLIFGYLLTKFPKKKIIPILFLLTAFIAILLTGERSNTIKVFFGIIIFFILSDFIDLKKKFFSLLIIFSIIILSVKSFDFLSNRYIGLINIFDSKEKIQNQYENNLYFKLYKSGFFIFKQYPYFGVGNKNYRIKSCEYAFDKKKIDANKYLCSTHPHQVYFELLSEHGLIGSIILLCMFFYIFFRILREILMSKNQIQLGCFIFVLLSFTPILPSGSFFSDFNLTIFWLNFSLMFASNKKTNIFRNTLNN